MSSGSVLCFSQSFRRAITRTLDICPAVLAMYATAALSAARYSLWRCASLLPPPSVRILSSAYDNMVVVLVRWAKVQLASNAFLRQSSRGRILGSGHTRGTRLPAAGENIIETSSGSIPGLWPRLKTSESCVSVNVRTALDFLCPAGLDRPLA